MADDYAELIVVLALVKHAGEDEDIPTLEENAKSFIDFTLAVQK